MPTFLQCPLPHLRGLSPLTQRKGALPELPRAPNEVALSFSNLEYLGRVWGLFLEKGDHKLFLMRALFPKPQIQGPSRCPPPPLPGSIIWEVKATALKLSAELVLGSGLERSWQASDVVPCTCPGPRTLRRGQPEMLLPALSPPCLRLCPSPQE